MANPISPHDKYFRSSMQNSAIARQFFHCHLPQQLRVGFNFNAMTQLNSTYIDDSLQETISDLVFSCPYDSEVNEAEDGESDVKLVLLVEHQSTPDRLMAFRVFHYLFNLLHSLLKQQPESQSQHKLPAVYAMIFYHGKQTPYPYSMNLMDSFDDPLNIMQGMFSKPVHLVDINQVQDSELKKQQLLGIMSGALKHSRDRDISRYLLQLTDRLNSVDLSDDLALKFLRTTLNYLLGVGNTADVEQFIKGGLQLAEPVRGEFMTIAEQLRAMGAEEGLEKGLKKGRKEIAINLLEEGLDPHFVARNTGLELDVILKLKAKLK
ncbi:MAG: putative transposase/invertase (TIGR01784 family) [Phenylobacterium sp.]|jgi:predicted transposase/invertase (TIGR01784 family)